MPGQVRLARLLRRREVPILLRLLAGGPVAVYDAKGAQLAGPVLADEPVPVLRADGSTLGAVAGPAANAAATALSTLADLDQERRELADEVLDMYREVNLLYALGEVLATAEDRPDLARRTLREATRLVDADAAAIVVDVGRPTLEASTQRSGDGSEALLQPPEDLTRLRIEQDDTGALLVAPLAFRDTQRGALFLRRRFGTFSAGDLKLIGAVAAQCAGVLERVLDEEARARAAADREAALQRQIQQLRIELDHERQSEQVERITETDYFGGLRAQAADLRRIIADGPG
jgi:GAF domain-containing protein